MKTLDEILKQPPVFLHDWKNKEYVISSFAGIDITSSEDYKNSVLKWDHINILFASYKVDRSGGYAFILFEHNNQLFEVNASHESIIDFEGQFIPTETTISALKNRLIQGGLWNDNEKNYFAKELKEFLGIF